MYCRAYCARFYFLYTGVAQLVELVVWDHEVAGSSPVSRTIAVEGYSIQTQSSCVGGLVGDQYNRAEDESHRGSST